MVCYLGRRAVCAPLASLLMACFLVFAPLAAGATPSYWLARSVPVRIMALGDSITAGVGEHGIDTGSGGYRAAGPIIRPASPAATMRGGRGT
jgi:hypothetical protein